MKSRTESATVVAGPAFSRFFSAVVLVLAAAMLGCQPDHRISLQEFLTLQEQQAEVPATQPAAPSEKMIAMIDEALGPYEVEPGDVLQIVATGIEEGLQFPPLTVRVDRKGEVELPGVGTVELGGLELEDAEDRVRGAYVPRIFKEGVVHVQLVDPKVTEVLVIGAVTQPGLVSLRSSQRDLLHAIVAAGGVSDIASGDVTLKRLRNPDEMVTVGLTEPAGLQTALTQEPLRTGDIVAVHAAAPNTLFVGGLVNLPNPQLYPQGVDMTVLQAIAGAGGLRVDVTPREGTLIRRMEDGTDVHVKLDLDRISTGQDPNITLAAGDVLWVPHTAETRIQEWVNRNIFFRAGVSVTANGNYGLNYSHTGVDYLNSNARQSQLGGNTGSSLQDLFDPFGYLLRNQTLGNLAGQ